jgi:hypothetical protein
MSRPGLTDGLDAAWHRVSEKSAEIRAEGVQLLAERAAATEGYDALAEQLAAACGASAVAFLALTYPDPAEQLEQLKLAVADAVARRRSGVAL